MVGLKPSDVPPPLGVKMASAGAAACIADLVTFPLDTAKVRLQCWCGSWLAVPQEPWQCHLLSPQMW
uniref:Uncharacterized protein n=1 Tax=Periophthalmus magnuspinnatus TaxID=409849 RepID=A0A3B3ZGW0_9GOBI